ncbi:MAG TPA: hypothetical protein VFR05_02590 [Terriglobia bacterium]|nr:hypothetical protein [Terriglobia bacterium]
MQIFISLLFFCGVARAQDPALLPSIIPPEPSRTWMFSASAANYFLPGDYYVQPTITVDRGWLHLEGRYNYEDRKTGSAWVGYNFSAGRTVSLSLTPMIGGVFGRTEGVAPGYRASLGWRRFQLYSEGEYVFNTDEETDSFFYTWSELTFRPLNWLEAGGVGQRTRAYHSEREIQRGVLVRVNLKRFGITANAFNLDEDPFYVLSVNFEF